LQRMPHLRELSLDHTGVSDKGIDTLRSMAGLRILDLYHTSVTKAGFETLRTSLPDCQVAFDELSGKRSRGGE